VAFCVRSTLLPLTLFAQTVPLTQDSYVVPASPANFGSAVTINVGGAGADTGIVQFDLSTLPAGTVAASVFKATLIVFVNKVSSPGTVNFSVANGSWDRTGCERNKRAGSGCRDYQRGRR
jgi:hypothetical protein